MGLNRCAIYISRAEVTDALAFLSGAALLPRKAGELRGVKDQSEIREGEFGVTKDGHWVLILADSGAFLEGEALGLLGQLSRDREVFMWLAQSTSGGKWFEMWRNGELIRKWVEVEGAVEENIGQELPQEPRNYFNSESQDDGRDEWATSILAGEVTGLSITRIFEMPFAVYKGRNG